MVLERLRPVCGLCGKERSRFVWNGKGHLCVACYCESYDCTPDEIEELTSSLASRPANETKDRVKK